MLACIHGPEYLPMSRAHRHRVFAEAPTLVGPVCASSLVFSLRCHQNLLGEAIRVLLTPWGDYTLATLTSRLYNKTLIFYGMMMIHDYLPRHDDRV